MTKNVGRWWMILVSSGLMVGLTGCSQKAELGTGDTGGGGGDTITGAANISGLVSSTAGGSSFMQALRAARKSGDTALVQALQVGVLTAESGCSIAAQNMETGLVESTATSDANGEFVVTGLDAGVNYTLETTCGAQKYSAIAQADETAAEDKTPTAVDPRSTMIAAMIADAVIKAVDEALDNVSSLPASVKEAVKDAIFAALDSIILTITETVTTAIENGSMPEPTKEEASAVADQMEELPALGSTDTTAALEAVEDVQTVVDAEIEIPATVEDEVKKTAAQGSKDAACDPDLGATVATCTRAMAKLMYSLGFPVGLRMTGGAFTLSACTAAAVETDAGLVGAKAMAGDGSNGAPTGICMVSADAEAVDRNKSSDQYEGHDDGGPAFAETFDWDNDSAASDPDDTGVLTAIAESMIAGNSYKLANLDRLVFDIDTTTKSGMNARLLGTRRVLNTSVTPNRYEDRTYYWDGTNWTATGVVPNDHTEMWCRGQYWNEGCLSRVFANTTNKYEWSAANCSLDSADSLIAAIGATPNHTLGLFLKQFGGAVPTQSELDAYIDEGRVHEDHNPSGQKEFWVLYTENMDHSDQGCRDNDSSTTCNGVSGAANPAMRVDITLGAADSIGFRPITTVTKSATGAYVVRPFYNQNGFSGILGFTKISDGRELRATHNNSPLSLKLILDQSTECNDSTRGIPSTGCADGALYNVGTNWDNCNGGGGSCPDYAAVNGTATAATTAGGLSFAPEVNYKSKGLQFQSGDRNSWAQVLGSGQDWGNLNPILYSVTTVASGKDTVTPVGFGTPSTGQYYGAMHWMCDTTGCTSGGFYLVDGDGNAYADSEISGQASSEKVDVWAMNSSMGPFTASKFTQAELTANAGAFDHDGERSGTQTFASALVNKWVPNGPFPNPNFKCDKEPFFVDGNANGVLDCNTANTAPINGDVSFSHSDWEVQMWREARDADGNLYAGRATAVVLSRDNAYQFRDPAAIKKLMGTAFEGWFDGEHTIDADTPFNAAQAFALVYMWFESENGSRSIANLDTSDPTTLFKTTSPMFSENMGIDSINVYIGNAMKNFHQ